MRVLVLLRGFDSLRKREIGKFELDQARALAAAGHDVRAIAIDIRSQIHLRRWGCYTYVMHGIPVIYSTVPCTKLTPQSAHWAGAAALKKAFRFLERDGWKPEIVHAHFHGKGEAFCALPESDVIPFVITEHASEMNCETLPEELRESMISVFQKASAVIAVGSGLAENIYRNTGFRARVVPNIVDLDSFRLQPMEHSGFRFAAAGSLIHRKGYDLLLEALALVRERGCSAELTIFGSGKEEKMLRRRMVELGLKEHVMFRGQSTREEMAAYYRETDAFVLPSRLETFGVVYIEAMAAGLPVIATACGGPEDFVDETNGILIPTEDVSALADAMEKMVRTRGGYDSAAIAAGVRARFSPEVVAGELTTLYEEILSC